MDNWQCCYWKIYLEEKHMFQWQFPPWVQKRRGKQHVSSIVTVPEFCIFWFAFQDIQGFFSTSAGAQGNTGDRVSNQIVLWCMHSSNWTHKDVMICWWLNQLSDHSGIFWINSLETNLAKKKKIWFSAHTNLKLNLHLCYFYYFLVHPHFRNNQSEV